ncbi:MAG: PQQ-binding-like beta-propeller repeat protein, partial [Mucilaginibacter polytrichastri]|nr:PQQ-binding-like beta-propeller repeat protein [Mucilaginibacter polytrichastri]
MLNKFFAGSIFVLLLPVFFSCGRKPKSGDWAVYKGSNEGLNYSALAQIDTDNVKRLKPVWEYHTGDADTVHHSQIQCNPLVIDGVLYGTSPQLKLFAIDAATGKEKWQFNPFDTISTANKALYFILNNNRGVTYWNGGEKDKRIFYVAGSAMYAINAITGKPVQEFGENGSVDLHIGLDRDVKDLFVTATSPPVIYKNLLIIGSRVDEGAQASPGHIRAYDVRTGRLKWIFHTIPHPQEAGYTSWDDPNAYKFIGGANAWSGLTLDEKRGIVFASTGSASYDFYGGKRTGDNLYANSLIALDAETGKRKWHFQYLHHDVWDRDLSSPPALITMKKDGQKIDAVALTTKTGFLYFFERENGKPVYKIEERPVPHTSELEGEKLSATQPFPTFPAPFMRQIFREQDINPFLPDSSRADIRKRLLSYKNDSMYNPISFQGTVVFP